MDRHFLEFWGNFLLPVAKGQKQLEDMSQWSRGFFGGDLTSLFGKSYGINHLDKGSPDYLKLWEKAHEDFRHSFREYLGLLGVLPREEYAELARKYEELKEKVAEQEEIITHLRLLLSEKGLDFGAVTSELQKLMDQQSDQFQKLLQSFGEIFKADSTGTDVNQPGGPSAPGAVNEEPIIRGKHAGN